MDDVHKKTITLKHTTVKVPGKRPPKATTPVQGTVAINQLHLVLNGLHNGVSLDWSNIEFFLRGLQ